MSERKVVPEKAAEELDALCRKISGLVVYGVGVGDDALIVYCHGRRQVRSKIPSDLYGFTVVIAQGKVTRGSGVAC